MEEFASYFIFRSKERELIDQLPQDNMFKFGYRDDPSKCHWEDINSLSTSRMFYEPSVEDINRNKKHQQISSELIILGENIDEVLNFQQLIYACVLLLNPCVTTHKPPQYPYQTCYNYLDVKDYHKCVIAERIDIACRGALNAWGKKELIYSLEKIKFSMLHDSITPHSNSPVYGRVFLNISDIYSSHVNAGYAFLSAYSVIEELGLEIRSSSKTPRFIKGIKNDWNPVVVEDISCRLKKLGIDFDEDFIWVQRGEETELQKSIDPKLGEHTEWYNENINRDLKLRIFEAIHYASYIRNFFLAHKFSDVVSQVGPYDVNNVQRLARFLLLHALGIKKLLN